MTAISIAIVAVVGWADYLTGYELFLFVFYLFAVFLAAWYVDITTGILISALSVAAWISADIAAGKQFANIFIPVWNAAIMFVSYLVVVGLLARLRSLYRELEERVRKRTEALTREMRERIRLQKELLETSEREQQRIGHDLHDSLSQHLTGTALAGQALGQKLADRSLPETREADRLVELVEEAIELTRKLARGLHPVEMQAGQLIEGLQELAANASERFNVACKFEGGSIALSPDANANVSIHLYRIAQEAITNAVRHGKAKHINLGLAAAATGEMVLTVTDDGIGLPDDARNSKGMGLRIMTYRADMMGARFNIERLPAGGTRVTCTLPAGGVSPKNHDEQN